MPSPTPADVAPEGARSGAPTSAPIDVPLEAPLDAPLGAPVDAPFDTALDAALATRATPAAAPGGPGPSAPTLDWHDPWQVLGAGFSVPCPPTPLRAPRLLALSPDMAAELGLAPDWLATPEATALFSGNAPHPTRASVYSGHQFGVWAGQLGDGRALLLGDLPSRSGRQEIQLKGAGRTPFSRMGDGRAVLRSSIREFLCSEAMHGLGIPTTRALCLTGSDDPVRREEVETAAVVTRVAPSFIRFGHFEHFAHHDQPEMLRRLADRVIEQHYPEARAPEVDGGAPGAGPRPATLVNPYARLLACVAERTARLMAQWQCVGFCHGVMNTDNMSILGLTMDYGPFQFLDGYAPGHICNHSDHQGRYAFGRQPAVAHWNLFQLAQALVVLCDDTDQLNAALARFQDVFPTAYLAGLSAKLGVTPPAKDDAGWIAQLLDLMAREGTDTTIFWRRLSHAVAAGLAQDAAATQALDDLFIDAAAWHAWREVHLDQLQRQAGAAGLAATAPAIGAAMLRVNPKFVLRNHLAETAIQRAKAGDVSEVHTLQRLLARPFDEHPGFEAWAGFAPAWAAQLEISCSS